VCDDLAAVSPRRRQFAASAGELPCRFRWHAAGMTADGLRHALDSYTQAQDELVEARNRLARAIAGAAMSGLTKDEIVDLTGYPADLVLRICQDAGISESS
jgi:hypothetical protein